MANIVTVSVYEIIGRYKVGNTQPVTLPAHIGISVDSADVIATLGAARKADIVKLNNALSPIATSIVKNVGGVNQIEYLVSQAASTIITAANA